LGKIEAWHRSSHDRDDALKTIVAIRERTRLDSAILGDQMVDAIHAATGRLRSILESDREPVVVRNGVSESDTSFYFTEYIETMNRFYEQAIEKLKF
jgi:hypothetical protein